MEKVILKQDAVSSTSSSLQLWDICTSRFSEVYAVSPDMKHPTNRGVVSEPEIQSLAQGKHL